MQSLHGKIKALRSVSRGAGILYAKGLEAVKAGHENDGYAKGCSSNIAGTSDRAEEWETDLIRGHG